MNTNTCSHQSWPRPRWDWGGSASTNFHPSDGITSILRPKVNQVQVYSVEITFFTFYVFVRWFYLTARSLQNLKKL